MKTSNTGRHRTGGKKTRARQSGVANQANLAVANAFVDKGDVRAERARFDEFVARSEAAKNTAVPLTLREVCALVGWEVDPQHFAVSALERIAQQVEDTADAVNGDGMHHEHWLSLMSIATRMRMVAEIETKLRGGVS